ncbi:olfactory receptor 4D1-like [Trachemys scripta elegans]|uniref:olfactory receptor 4D1-like n=1 Tax=Trachemys scripta elegans TaxID=31138 RepID=UPI001556C23D|nr:olfactory receptor 4D1-like [Trachemys scripta elegans]
MNQEMDQLFLIIYLLTLLGNSTIIVAIFIDPPPLHTPMYFFLSNLALVDICYTSCTVPKMLSNFIAESRKILSGGCMAQLYFFVSLLATDCFLLKVMAYDLDRYVAIYKPLQYLTIMNQGVCVGLVSLAWLRGFAHSFVQIELILQLPFCGLNILDNFYCDVPQIIKLACTDTYLIELLMVFNGGLLLIIVFVFLLTSYTVILVKIRTHDTEGKHKSLATCGTQITVASLIFIPGIFIYARPFRKFPMDKLVSVLYTLITPMLNPMIYTLRNAEMKKSIRRLIRRMLLPGRKREA